jgi:predicted  nucleic acid-binding Zn-ribbon protein
MGLRGFLYRYLPWHSRERVDALERAGDIFIGKIDELSEINARFRKVNQGLMKELCDVTEEVRELRTKLKEIQNEFGSKAAGASAP